MRHSLALLVVLGLVALSSCKGNKSITIDVSPTTAQLSAGGVQMFTANVHHSHSNPGVTWTLSGTSCSGATCGTLDSTTANPVTYTAPATAPASNMMVTLTATSVADTSQSASAIITVLALSISVSPSSASVVVNATQQITATVFSDPSNGGVTWTLTQSGVNCSPTCGSLSANSSLSGAPITFTAPSSVPSPATVTLTATVVAAPNPSAKATFTITTAAAACGSGSESLFSGQYAFLLQGFDQNGAVAIAGSFTADGTGKITAGGEDINNSSGAQKNLTISPSSSSASGYSVGADNRGCLTIVNSNGTTTKFRFALGSLTGTPSVATKGQIIEFDDAAGTGAPPLARGSGFIRKQDATSFTTSLSGTYAFGLSGNDSSGGRFAIAGVLTAAGAGSLTTGNADADDAGGVATDVVCAGCGNYSTSLDANGRGTAMTTFPTPLITVDFAFYQVSASEAIFISVDSILTVPIQSGEALLESGAGSFSATSISGNSVIRTEGFGGGGTTGPSVSINLLTITSTGNFSLIEDLDQGGTVTNNSSRTGTYSVASNGRVTLPSGGGKNPPVLYLINANTAFLVGTGGASELGFVEPQSGSSFSNSSLSGNFFFGTEGPTGSGVTMQSGAESPSGGNFTGTADSSGPGGLTHGQSISGSYSVTSNGTGTIGVNGVLIVISSTKFVFIDESPGNTNPSVTIVDR
ncbi:MAG TPA: hypothetical protein VJN21_06700 [Candidatus Acidoferrales bacterium]|nr:hypothetical protein [Candidatus Acidoferrales bacterium]